jgi:hypothetical protein
MSGSTRQYLLGMALALGLVGSALAQQAAPASVSPSPAAGPPAGFVAPAEPGVDENNAQRAKSQPGNNAPMWRAFASPAPSRCQQSARCGEGRVDPALCPVPRLPFHHGG